jgi:hypothetical protein
VQPYIGRTATTRRRPFHNRSEQASGDGSHAAGERDSQLEPLEFGHRALEPLDRRIRDPAVDRHPGVDGTGGEDVDPPGFVRAVARR